MMAACYVCLCMQNTFANPSRELAVNIAIEMTPFFSFESANQSNIFCLLTPQPLSKNELSAYSSKAEKLSPSLKFEVIHNVKLSNDCQFVFVDNQDNLFVQKSLPFINKQSMIIGVNEDIIYQSGHVALIRVGNRFTININKKNMLQANIRPSAQILSLAKILIE